MSLSGFGGVLAWARRILVEQRRWLTANQFNETFALCAFLPGGNIVNICVIFGTRTRGPVGALALVRGAARPAHSPGHDCRSGLRALRRRAGPVAHADRRRRGGGRADARHGPAAAF